MAKTQDNTNAEDKVELDVMPGADPISEEDAKGFEVDMNFETPEEDEEAQEEADENVEVEEESLEEPEEDEEEEVVEAADAEAEDSGEEELLAEDEGDTQQPEGTNEEGLAQKEPMIPKSRFDEVLAKQKALQKKLDEATAPKVEDVTEAPEFDFDAKEVEFANLLMEGETEKATKLRSEIRAAEKQQLMYEMQAKMGQTVTQATEQEKLQAKAFELEAKYPELNQADPSFNQDKTNEVLELRDAYMTQGYTGADALDKSVKLIMGASAPEAPKADPAQEKIIEKKKIANTNKKVEASQKQPPTMKGKNKVEKKVDINTMSVDEFDALPPETLRRMRGDFG